MHEQYRATISVALIELKSGGNSLSKMLADETKLGSGSGGSGRSPRKDKANNGSGDKKVTNNTMNGRQLSEILGIEVGDD